MKLNRTIKMILLALGLVMAAMAIWTKSTYPSQAEWMPKGFNTPIVAFEFLQTNEEVKQFFGPESPERDQFVEQMKQGHQVDNFFLISYGLFLIAWAGFYFSEKQNKFFVLVILLGLFAAVNDAIENQQLSYMTNYIETGKFDTELKHLFIATWIKWGGLAVAMAGLAIRKWSRGWLGKAFAAVSAVTIVLGLVAFFNRSVVTTWFTMGIMAQFALLVVFAVVEVFGGKKSDN